MKHLTHVTNLYSDRGMAKAVNDGFGSGRAAPIAKAKWPRTVESCHSIPLDWSTEVRGLLEVRRQFDQRWVAIGGTHLLEMNQR